MSYLFTIPKYDWDNKLNFKYSKVPSGTEDVFDYLGQLVLSGTYEDENKMKYIFENGNLNWNGKPKKYRIIFDYVEFFPLSSIVINEVWYGFVTNGSMLQLYSYDDNAKKIMGLVLDLNKEKNL